MSLEKKLLEIVKGLQKLAKAREDKLVHPEHRKMFREHKAKMDSHDPISQELTGQAGTSSIGIEIRRADKKEPGAIAHGYARVGEPEHHREKAAKRLRGQLDHIKSQAKPNLPKSERVAKSDHEDIVSGVKVPHELKQHKGAIPREHPHREIAAKFVTDVRRKNPAEGRRMSAKYLNIDESGNDIKDPSTDPKYSTVKSEKISIGPTIVSSPDMKDRDDSNHPAIIQSPNVLTEHGTPLNNKEQAKRILRMAGKFKQSIGSKK
jgi:hypothetical protein